MPEYQRQALYSDGYAAGYAQAIADADAELRKRGDDRTIRHCRQVVLALVHVPFNPDEAMPRPDWSKHKAPDQCPHIPPTSNLAE